MSELSFSVYVHVLSVFVLCSTLVSFNHTWEIYVRFMCVVSVCVSLLMHKAGP